MSKGIKAEKLAANMFKEQFSFSLPKGKDPENKWCLEDNTEEVSWAQLFKVLKCQVDFLLFRGQVAEQF